MSCICITGLFCGPRWSVTETGAVPVLLCSVTETGAVPVLLCSVHRQCSLWPLCIQCFHGVYSITVTQGTSGNTSRFPYPRNTGNIQQTTPRSCPSTAVQIHCPFLSNFMDNHMETKQNFNAVIHQGNWFNLSAPRRCQSNQLTSPPSPSPSADNACAIYLFLYTMYLYVLLIIFSFGISTAHDVILSNVDGN